MRPLAAMTAFLAFFIFLGRCGEKFGVRDRYEGVKDGAIRVYVRIDNSSNLDVDDDRSQLAESFRKKGAERAAALAKSNGIELRREAAGDGKIVLMKCGGDYCEAFLDYETGNGRKGKE